MLSIHGTGACGKHNSLKKQEKKKKKFHPASPLCVLCHMCVLDLQAPPRQF